MVLCVTSNSRLGAICFQDLHCMWLNSEARHDLQTQYTKWDTSDLQHTKQHQACKLDGVWHDRIGGWVNTLLSHSISGYCSPYQCPHLCGCTALLVGGNATLMTDLSKSMHLNAQPIWMSRVSTWCNGDTGDTMCCQECNAQCEYASRSGWGHKLEMARIPCHVTKGHDLVDLNCSQQRRRRVLLRGVYVVDDVSFCVRGL